MRMVDVIQINPCDIPSTQPKNMTFYSLQFTVIQLVLSITKATHGIPRRDEIHCMLRKSQHYDIMDDGEEQNGSLTG